MSLVEEQFLAAIYIAVTTTENNIDYMEVTRELRLLVAYFSIFFSLKRVYIFGTGALNRNNV